MSQAATIDLELTANIIGTLLRPAVTRMAHVAARRGRSLSARCAAAGIRASVIDMLTSVMPAGYNIVRAADGGVVGGGGGGLV
jgi:hypothetical protein